MANFKNLSRYTGGVIAKNRSNQDFLTLRRSLNLEPGDEDIFVQITQDLEYRPDLVAHKAYNDVNLWWVIFEFNEIRDPFFDLRTGMLIRLPALTRVLQAIEELEE